MDITHIILENGDLEFTVKFESDAEKLEILEKCRVDYQSQLDLFWNEVDSNFRFVSNIEKAYYGDLYSGEIITNIDEEDYQNKDKSNEIVDKTWFYKYYITTMPIEELFEKGKVIWISRNNF